MEGGNTLRILYILLPILLFFLLILFSRVRFTFAYDGQIRCYVRYLAFYIPIYPRKPQKKKKKKKKGASATKKSSKAPATKRQGASLKEGHKKSTSPLRLGDVRLLLRLGGRVLSSFLERASRHVRIRVSRLHVTVGGARDAAVAAMEYGAAAQALSYLLELLHQTGYLIPPREGNVGVAADFLREGHSHNAKLSVECRLIFLSPLALSTLADVLRARGVWLRRRARATSKHRQNKITKENENG